MKVLKSLLLVCFAITTNPSQAAVEEPPLLLRLQYTLEAPHWLGPTIFVDAFVYRDGSIVQTVVTADQNGTVVRAPPLSNEFAQLLTSLSENRAGTHRRPCGKLLLPVPHLYQVNDGRLVYVRRD